MIWMCCLLLGLQFLSSAKLLTHNAGLEVILSDHLLQDPSTLSIGGGLPDALSKDQGA